MFKGILGIARDITGESSRRSVTVIRLPVPDHHDSMGDAIHMVNEELRLLLVNKTNTAMEQRVRAWRPEMVGQNDI